MFDLKPVLVNLKSTHVRIGPDFSIILRFFAVFCVLRRQETMGGKVISAIDRAR